MKAWRPETRELLVARLEGSDQEADLSEATNCGGIGRRRHFHSETHATWPVNPLPIEPAERYLRSGPRRRGRRPGLPEPGVQLAMLVLLCPVQPAERKHASRGEFVTAAGLVRRYLSEPDPPPILDISGGQPDLVPEWTLDTLRAVEQLDPGERPFVWTDDNLELRLSLAVLSGDEISWMASLPNHARVGCFKGFDESSFSLDSVESGRASQRSSIFLNDYSCLVSTCSATSRSRRQRPRTLCLVWRACLTGCNRSIGNCR